MLAKKRKMKNKENELYWETFDFQSYEPYYDLVHQEMIDEMLNQTYGECTCTSSINLIK